MSAFTQAQFDAFIAQQKYPPNHFQQEILHSLAFGDGNILVNALAGSGKTTLLMQAAALLQEMGANPSKAMFLAFNVKIRDEMNERLPSGWTAINSHSLGMQILKQQQSKTRVDFKKWKELCDSLVKEKGYLKDNYMARMMLDNLCSKAMMSNLKLVDLNAEEAAALPLQLQAVAAHFGIGGEDEDDLDKQRMLRDMIGLVPKAMLKAKKLWESTGGISFDEMIYWPIALNLPIDKMDYVFVDEAQDLNKVQQQLAIRSCSETGRMIFVGDHKQSLYGFAGADAEGFHNIKNLVNAAVLPLNICYRCPTSHLDLARGIVSQIEDAPAAKAGSIHYYPPEKALEVMQRGSLILCRLTAPLVSAYFKLIGSFATKSKESRIPVKMLGRDIASMLSGVLDKINKMPSFTYERIGEYLSEYEKRQRDYLIQKEAKESQISQLEDSIEVLHICVENFSNCHDIACLKNELKDLFGDESDQDYTQSKYITLLTVHRAKGLEAEQVAILKPDKMPLTWKSQQEWEFEQEMNILYVALTRSKEELIVFGEPGSLNTEATPATAKPNSRKITEFEEIVIDGDVTDVLPDVEAISEPIFVNALIEKPRNSENDPLEVPTPSIVEKLDLSETAINSENDVPVPPPTFEELDHKLYSEPAAPVAHDPIDLKPSLNLTSGISKVKPETADAPDTRQPALFDLSHKTANRVTGDLKQDMLNLKNKKRQSLLAAIQNIHDISTLDAMIELLSIRREELVKED